MTLDHDAIDELLAGYVLRALSGPDADEADRLLRDHVPGCAACQETLDAFQGLTGDLAVSTAPIAPPELLLPRLQAELEPRRTRRMPSWGGARALVAVAAVIAVIGIAGVAVTASGGGSDPVLANADLARIRSLQERPDTETTDLGEAEELTVPGVEEAYVYGEHVSAPPAGMTYRLWAIDAQGARYLGDFTPVGGIVALELHLDGQTVRLLVTVEPAGSEPGAPGQPAWGAA